MFKKIHRIQPSVLFLSKPTGNRSLHFGTILLGIYFTAFTNTPAFWYNFMFRAMQMESFCTPSLQTAFFCFMWQLSFQSLVSEICLINFNASVAVHSYVPLLVDSCWLTFRCFLISMMNTFFLNMFLIPEWCFPLPATWILYHLHPQGSPSFWPCLVAHGSSPTRDWTWSTAVSTLNSNH